MSNPYVITDQMVDEILSTAMDSGSAYWTRRVRVIGGFPVGVESTLFPGSTDLYASECLTKGRDLAWFIDDEDESGPRTLTLKKMKAGIKRAAEHFGQTPAAFYEDHDDTMADVAVQFALLGEIVYG